MARPGSLLETRMREYISQVIHLSLSTTNGNKPWTSEVHYAFDDALDFYILSLPSRRHSQEILHNPNVSGVITKQHTPGQAPYGVYFEGTAAQLSQLDDVQTAKNVYLDRFNTDATWLDTELEKADGHRFYKITVSDFYVFDAVFSKPSQKYHIAWNQNES